MGIYSLRCLSKRKEERLKFNRKLSYSDRLFTLPRVWQLSLQSLLHGYLSHPAEIPTPCSELPRDAFLAWPHLMCMRVSVLSRVWLFVTPCFSVHEIFQARILEWVAISFSRRSSWPRDRTGISCVSCIGRWVFATAPPGKPPTSNAAAKSLQSCPTLCDPIDGSPPGSPVPGIVQARTLEWVAISFSNPHLMAPPKLNCWDLWGKDKGRNGKRGRSKPTSPHLPPG